MCSDEFRVVQSPGGYSVELMRDGQPYVVFLHGVTRQTAEQAARDLTRLWRKISPNEKLMESAPLQPQAAEGTQGTFS